MFRPIMYEVKTMRINLIWYLLLVIDSHYNSSLKVPKAGEK